MKIRRRPWLKGVRITEVIIFRNAVIILGMDCAFLAKEASLRLTLKEKPKRTKKIPHMKKAISGNLRRPRRRGAKQ